MSREENSRKSESSQFSLVNYFFKIKIFQNANVKLKVSMPDKARINGFLILDVFDWLIMDGNTKCAHTRRIHISGKVGN